MSVILQTTSRGQMTLPKQWRDLFDTSVFVGEIDGQTLIIRPLKTQSLEEEIENSWKQYKKGKVKTHSEMKKKYAA